MAWKGVITTAGNELHARWSAGESLRITRAEAGTGRVDEASMMAQTKLLQKMQEASILGNESLESGQRLKLQITSHTVGYKLNQFGVWAAIGEEEEKMIALYQTSDDAGLDIPGGENTSDFAYTFFAFLEFSGEGGAVEVMVDPAALVTREDVEKLSAKDVGADPAGSAAAVQANLDSHCGGKNNPHYVTKSQVGLGNVPNVSTNDQTPTYTAASALTAMTSGEKLSVAFGKIAKAIADLVSHISNKSNPHGVTASQAGAVPTSRTVNGKALSANISLSASDVGAAASSHGNHVPATQTANNAKFLRNDNTWQTVTPANIGAAAASHGNHVPATQTANNAKFLRNDNTWQTVTPANIGAAPASHTQAIDTITGLTDYVTANGTSGVWSYWKFNSGLCVAIGTPTVAWGTYNSLATNQYRSTAALDLTGIFTAVMGGTCSNAHRFVNCFVIPSGSTSAELWATSAANANVSQFATSMKVVLFGKWK